MTIAQLKCFVAVAQELNYARAAELLYVSQPAVSQHIRSLEKELGVQLFYRSARTVKLTAAGELLLEDALDILSRVDRTTQRLTKFPEKETLNLGCSSTLIMHNLSLLLQLYREEQAETKINILSFTVEELRKMLDDEIIDAALAPKEMQARTPGYRYKRIRKGGLYCIVGKQHRFCQRESVSFEDLSGEELIMLSNRRCPPMMRRAQQIILDRCPDIRISTSGAALFTVSMVAAGLGIAVIPEFVVPQRPDIEMVPFIADVELEKEFEYGIIFPDGELPARTRALLRVINRLPHGAQAEMRAR